MCLRRLWKAGITIEMPGKTETDADPFVQEPLNGPYAVTYTRT
jgi:hypothetical protein